jgi:hypothetical protein
MAHRLWWTGRVPNTLSIPWSAFRAYRADTVAILDGAVDQQGASQLDLSLVSCRPATGCDAARNGAALHFDGNHLLLAWSALVVPSLAEAVLATLIPRD